MGLADLLLRAKNKAGSSMTTSRWSRSGATTQTAVSTAPTKVLTATANFEGGMDFGLGCFDLSLTIKGGDEDVTAWTEEQRTAFQSKVYGDFHERARRRLSEKESTAMFKDEDVAAVERTIANLIAEVLKETYTEESTGQSVTLTLGDNKTYVFS